MCRISIFFFDKVMALAWFQESGWYHTCIEHIEQCSECCTATLGMVIGVLPTESHHVLVYETCLVWVSLWRTGHKLGIFDVSGHFKDLAHTLNCLEVNLTAISGFLTLYEVIDNATSTLHSQHMWNLQGIIQQHR